MRVEIISTGCANNFLHHHPPPQPSPPSTLSPASVCGILVRTVRANVRKVDGNGSPFKNAVFGVYDSEEAAKNEDVALARLTTGADGLSQEGGEPENKKNMVTIQN